MTKRCCECKQFKNLETFVKNKNTKDGLGSICKDCHKKVQSEYRKKYPWKQILLHIKSRCNNPNDKFYHRYGKRRIKCLITEEEIKKLWFRDKAWKLKKPSIDRKDNNGNYIYSNCRFIEMIDNCIKSSIKSILQYNLDNNLIKEWNSIKEACIYMSTTPSNLSCALTGKSKTACGFKWKYKL